MNFDREFLRDSEAREWIKRYKKKVNDLGLYDARKWWENLTAEMVKIRGKEAVDDLRKRMNEYRK
jgi:ribosomal protein L7/L12